MNLLMSFAKIRTFGETSDSLTKRHSGA